MSKSKRLLDPDGSAIESVVEDPVGKKFDQHKYRWSLLPLAPIRFIVGVLTHGAEKYNDNNWQKVLNAEDRYYSAMMRHISAHVEGQFFDSEFGLPHLAHAGCCLLFWFWFELKSHNLLNLYKLGD